MTKKILREHWLADTKEGFDQFAIEIDGKPIMRLAQQDKLFAFQIDTLNCGFGAALIKQDDAKLYLVAYVSKKLISADRRCVTLDKEYVGYNQDPVMFTWKAVYITH